MKKEIKPTLGFDLKREIWKDIKFGFLLAFMGALIIWLSAMILKLF